MRQQLSTPAEIQQALERGAPLRMLLVRSGELSPEARDTVLRCRDAGIRVVESSARDLERMAASGPAEVLAMVGPDPEASLEELLAGDGAVWLLAGVAYPGNCGFAIRAAEVSGAAGILVDAPFDRAGRRMACRTSMGADRFFPVHWSSASTAVDAARAAGRRIVGIEDAGDPAPWESDLCGRVLFLIGGEAGGIPPEVLAACDDVLRIPMAGFVPSYNLQAALAMVAGERLRQLQRRSEAADD